MQAGVRQPTVGYRRPHVEEEATVARPFRPRTVRQAILLLFLLIVLAGLLAGWLDRAGF